VPGDGFFLKSSKHLIRTFCVCANGFQVLLKAFHCPLQLITLFASLKLLANFENAY
jgi:hypothetical protein